MPCLSRQILFVALLALGCAHRSGAAGGSREAIHVGVILSLTGSLASFGSSTLDGAQLAVDELNAAGGVLGRPLALDVWDDQGKAEIAAALAGQLTQDRSVVALLGEVSSSLSRAIAPVAQQAGVPMVVPASTNPAVTSVGDRIFRVCFIDPYQGEAMAHYAWESLGSRRVSVLVDDSSDYALGLTDSFQRSFVGLGGTIVSVGHYAQAEVDFSAQIAELQPLGPDAIYVPGYYTEVALIARQARERGVSARLLGGDGWDSDYFRQLGGEAVVGGLFTNHFAVDDPGPAVVAFNARYEARFGHTPDGLAALGYDATAMLAKAIGAAGSTERDAITDALAATHDFPGVTGPITMNARRDPQKPAVILRVTPDRFTYEETVGPW